VCSTVMMNDPIAMKYICIHISNIWYYEKNIQSTGTDEQKLRGIPIIGCNHTAAHFSYVLSLANHPCFFPFQQNFCKREIKPLSPY